MGLVAKQLVKSKEVAAPLVQPGESVRHVVPVLAGPIYWALFGAMGALFAKPRLIATTDSAIYVIKRGKPSTVEERHPLDSITVTAGKGFPVGRLRIGDKSVWVSKILQDESLKLAADAKQP